MKDCSPPPVEVRNLQRVVPVSIRRLQRFGEIACGLAWKYKRPRAEIDSMNAIFVLIVSDRKMAILHEKYCGRRGSTDVLTFQHGEIVISAGTARRQARIFQTNLKSEIQLYLLHGLLHLAGYDDKTPSKRRQMDRMQKRLFVATRRANV